MEKINGKSIFNGIAVGKILFYSKDAGQVKRVKITDTRAEMERYNRAKEKAVDELNAIYSKAVK